MQSFLAALFGYGQQAPAPQAKVVIPVKLERGALTKFGYHVDNTSRSRHIALKRAVKAEGFVPVIRRLSLIATFTKYRSPNYSRIFKEDQRWLSEQYRASSKSVSRRSSRRSPMPSRSYRSKRRGMSVSSPLRRGDNDDRVWEL